MLTPANPDVTVNWPHDSKLKGRALVNKAMPKQCSQMRLSCGEVMRGKPSPKA